MPLFPPRDFRYRPEWAAEVLDVGGAGDRLRQTMTAVPAGDGEIHVAIVVIPCYNEERRLDLDQVSCLLADPRLRICFVNDGSTDDTASVLDRIQQKYGDRVMVKHAVHNNGKAEAVRQGMLLASESDPDCIGYLDADFAASAEEFLRLVDILAEKPGISAVLGARVALLGRQIERSPTRHYVGRLFGSLASGVLGLRIYDTQCGAKVFRMQPRLLDAMARPFISRWVFDVEILSRLTRGGYGTEPLSAVQFAEVPLREWRDVAGSKLRPADVFASLRDLALIWRSQRQKVDERWADGRTGRRDRVRR